MDIHVRPRADPSRFFYPDLEVQAPLFDSPLRSCTAQNGVDPASRSCARVPRRSPKGEGGSGRGRTPGRRRIVHHPTASHRSQSPKTKKAASLTGCGFKESYALFPKPAESEETKDTKAEDQSISGRLWNGLGFEHLVRARCLHEIE